MKKSTLSMLTLLALTFSSTLEASENSGIAREYRIISGSYTWHEAKADANARGGHLATITSQAEWNNVVQQIGANNLQGFWLGATDEVDEGVWKWVTGEDFDYSQWRSGEPNNYSYAFPGNPENYLITIPGTGEWNDRSRYATAPYLLEKEWVNVPNNFKAEYGNTDDSILLSWDQVDGATEYRIFYAECSALGNEILPAQQIATVNGDIISYEFVFDFAEPSRQRRFFYISAANDNYASDITAYSAKTYGATRAHTDSYKDDFYDRLQFSIEKIIGLANDVAGGISIYYIEGIPVTTWIGNKIDDTFKGGSVYARQQYISQMTACPVDIELLTPNGQRITKTNAAKNGIIYIEGSFIEAGETNDIVIIPTDKAEHYTIEYVPEPGQSNVVFTAFGGDQHGAQVTISNEITSVSNNLSSSHSFLPEIQVEATSNRLAVVWRQGFFDTNILLQTSSDLVTWSNVEYAVSSYLTEALLDISATTNSQQFYRLKYK